MKKMPKGRVNSIWDMIFAIYWYGANLFLIGFPWFVYRVWRKAMTDSRRLDD